MKNTRDWLRLFPVVAVLAITGLAVYSEQDEKTSRPLRRRMPSPMPSNRKT